LFYFNECKVTVFGTKTRIRKIEVWKSIVLSLLNNVQQPRAGDLMLGVRLDKQLESRLSALAAKTQRSKSFLAKEALTRYIEEEERKQRENDLTIARWEEYQETGETISNDAMTEWLESWGNDQEKTCPVK
jgi:predicted transcriptional regulator